MESVKDRFLRYIAIDTQSEDDVECVPSTEKQFALAIILAEDLNRMGAKDVEMTDHCYIYATIPANPDEELPTIGLIAHLDTANAASGADIRPQIIDNYDGKDIRLSDTMTLSPETFPKLLDCVGETIICTDGTTLLGADDKAGVAEILTVAEQLLAPDAPKHGKIRIGITPDEEVGRGADFFDVEHFGADFAYTVDGGELGDFNYECFNAASADILIKGVSIHTGTAKGIMKNALLIGMELNSMLPVQMNPAYTDGYEGFFHLDGMKGIVEQTRMGYIIRDHDMELFEEKKRMMQDVCDFLNKKYGEGTVTLVMKDTYYNMKEKVDQYVIDRALNAMKKLGIRPVVSPIRGGTDGARLSFEGLPCPNICTGGYNFHGPYEFISLQSMEKIVELIKTIVCC